MQRLETMTFSDPLFSWPEGITRPLEVLTTQLTARFQANNEWWAGQQSDTPENTEPLTISSMRRVILEKAQVDQEQGRVGWDGEVIILAGCACDDREMNGTHC